MSKIIREFYEAAQIPVALIDEKIEKFNRHPDIKKEFEYWIEQKEYQRDSALEIEGYSASKLAKLSPLINGEAAFVLLIELRENPMKALKRINKGFYKR